MTTSKAKDAQAQADKGAVDTRTTGGFATAATETGGPTDRRFHAGDEKQQSPDLATTPEALLTNPELGGLDTSQPARIAHRAFDAQAKLDAVKAAGSQTEAKDAANPDVYPASDVRHIASAREGVTVESQARGVRPDTDAELEADRASQSTLGEAAQNFATAAQSLAAAARKG